MFGESAGAEVRPNEAGAIVADTWTWLASHYAYAELDEWCVMPDHLHGILSLTGVGKPLGQLIGAFKTVSTKRINARRETPGAVIWQRGYYDHIIRDDADLARIRVYIRNNPLSLPMPMIAINTFSP